MAKKAADERSSRSLSIPSPSASRSTVIPGGDREAVDVQKQIYACRLSFWTTGRVPRDLSRVRSVYRARYLRKAKAQHRADSRLSDFALPTLEPRLFSTAPVCKGLEQVQLTESLTEMREQLGADNDVVRRPWPARLPWSAPKELIHDTKLDDVAVRKQLYEGSARRRQCQHRSADRPDAGDRAVCPGASTTATKTRCSRYCAERRRDRQGAVCAGGVECASRCHLHVATELRRHRRATL